MMEPACTNALRVRSPPGSRNLQLSIPAPPQEAVEDVVRDLRDGQARHQKLLERVHFPRRTKQPASRVPDTLVPEQFFHVSRQPQCGDKSGDPTGLEQF